MQKNEVLDTAALLAWPPERIIGGFCIPLQMMELEKLSPERAMLLSSQGPNWIEPSNEFLSSAKHWASVTGDLPQLSEVDIGLLALSLEKQSTLCTDDYRMQNVAKAAKIRILPVIQRGITSSWKWELKCTGCRTVSAVEHEGDKIPDCDKCGSPQKLKRR